MALLLACAGPATRLQPGAVSPALCTLPFPATPCRLVHALAVELPGAGTLTLMAITVVDPAAGRMETSFMSPESKTLFEAAAEGNRVLVRRSVPPFTEPGRAEALARDLRFMLLPPSGSLDATGTRADGSPVCRYRQAGGGHIDVVMEEGRGWRVEEFSVLGSRQRSLTIGVLKNGYPVQLDFKALEPQPCSLRLRLIRTEQLSGG